MLKRFGKLILVAMLSLTIGLHWTVLQTVAWASMIASFSKSESLEVAVKQTFDGQHACKLCKLVQSAKSQESSQEHTGTKGAQSLDFWVGESPWHHSVPSLHSWEQDTPTFPATSRQERPPSPPPRYA